MITNISTSPSFKTLKSYLKEVVNVGASVKRHHNGEFTLHEATPALINHWSTFLPQLETEVSKRAAGSAETDLSDLLGDRTVVYAITDAEAKRCVRILLEDAAQSGVIAVDTETQVPVELRKPVELLLNAGGTVAARQLPDPADRYALDPLKGRVRLVQAYAGFTHVVLFDMNTVSWGTIAQLFQGPHALCLFNAQFDLKFILKAAIDPKGRIYDCQLAMRLLDPCFRWPMSMRDAVRLCLDTHLPKEHGDSDWSARDLSKGQLDYAALDAVMTYELWRFQRNEFDGIDEHAQALADGCLLAVSRMELAGMPINTQAHQEFIVLWRDELVRADQALREVTGGVLNADSNPNEVRLYLTGTLTIEQLEGWPKSEKTQQLCANKKAFMTHGGDVKGLTELMTVSAWKKGLSTYGSGLLARVANDGRLRSQFMIAGAKTGRFSSRAPNLQNLPKRSALFKKFRDIVEAPPGYLILSADYSQIELRALAAISGDEAMTEAYRQYGRHHRSAEARAPFDIHRVTAKGLTHDYESLPPADQDAWRSRAKGCNFGLSYGSGAAGFKDYLKAGFGVNVTLDESQDLIDKFKETYPGLAAWQCEQAQVARQDGYATTLGGRRWWWEWNAKSIDDFSDDELDAMEDWMLASRLSGYERNLSINLPIQGTCAEVMMVALTYLDDVLKGTGAELIGTVHDEVVLVVPDDPETLRYVRRIVLQKMTRAWMEFFPEAPWRGLVEVTVGKTWGTALSNEELREIHSWLVT